MLKNRLLCDTTTHRETANVIRKIIAALGFSLILATAAPAQQAALTVTPLGDCQLSASLLGSSVGLASCVGASFTATGSGTNLTTTSVTGYIRPGATISGTGVTAGTTIASQTSGTVGGAGVYVTSAATTSSGASLTSAGIPLGATAVVISVETAGVRWRDDGSAPTATVGMPIAAATVPYLYNGTLSALRFIAQSGSPILSAAFYR